MVNLYIKQHTGGGDWWKWHYMGQFSSYDAALLAGNKLVVLTADIRIFNQ